jgi:transcriptional regulator with XRE-family HTH domain
MKNIGQIIKEARLKKKLSLKKVEDITKIKSSFIYAIEKEKWEILPPFPTVLGFVKSLSVILDVDGKMAVAVLKRDYIPRKLDINPRPDVSSHFIWSPKLTFVLGIGVVALITLGYLAFQYVRFISPPSLTVESPKEGQIIKGGDVLVFGSTDSDVKVTVDNQPVLVDRDGKFSVSIGITQNTKEIDVIAVNRSGKSTTVARKIVVQ